jgi:hypothetical protein
MRAAEAAKLVSVFIIALVPSYLVERITEYNFLTSSSWFFWWSGCRTEFFIVSIVTGGILAGYLTRNTWRTSLAFMSGVAGLMILFYYACDPRVCYSFGIDGLEPLRLGFFFCCIGVGGIAMGAHLHGTMPTRFESKLTGFATVTAIAWYPIMFSMGGASLLVPFAPAPLLAVVAMIGFGVSAGIAGIIGRAAGVTTPVLAILLLVSLASGVAAQYFAGMAAVIELVLLVGVLSSLGGALVASRSGHHVERRLARPAAYIIASILLVFLMTTVIIPSAVNGIEPSNSGSSLSIGAPVYVGGFMAQSFVRSKGVSVSVDFNDTNPSVIQANNFLSAGIGAHSPHCCVDGIDFGYRFDVYLFNGGDKELVATAWEVCDDIMACGGHSWEDLLFSSTKVTSPQYSSYFLSMEWEDRTVYWVYSVDGGPLQNFTSYVPTSRENPYFNAGTLGPVPSEPYPSTPFLYGLPHYFDASIPSSTFLFQYGIMSRFPIGHGGWSVSFTCPAYLLNSSWTCASRSASIQGDQSFWKAIWRWGNPYPDVAALPNAANHSVTFTYESSVLLPSFESFW